MLQQTFVVLPVSESAVRVLKSSTQSKSKILWIRLSFTFGTAAIVIYGQQVAPVSADIMQSSADVSTTAAAVGERPFPFLYPLKGTGKWDHSILTLSV